MQRLLLFLVSVFLFACGDCSGGPTGSPGDEADAGSNSRFRTEPDMAIAPCRGCFDDNGDCVAGDTAEACGEGGSRCQVCEAGTACVDDGACTAPPSCGPDTCDGCCNADDECVDGGTVASCGAGGNGCAVCPDGASCTDGFCELGCSSATCDGCCDAGGECVTIATDVACGAGGAACEDCTLAGGTCGGAACVTTSCSETCAGCCMGDVCIEPTTDAQCGAGGASCVACGQSQVCGATGVCETMANTDGLWDLTILSADIAPTKPGGAGWDTFSPLPEVYVIVTVPSASGYDERYTSVIPETLTPIWEETVLTGIEERYLTEWLWLDIIDQDDFFDDDICLMDITVDSTMLQGGIIETICDTDPRTRLRWRLDPH